MKVIKSIGDIQYGCLLLNITDINRDYSFTSYKNSIHTNSVLLLRQWKEKKATHPLKTISVSLDDLYNNFLILESEEERKSIKAKFKNNTKAIEDFYDFISVYFGTERANFYLRGLDRFTERSNLKWFNSSDVLNFLLEEDFVISSRSNEIDYIKKFLNCLEEIGFFKRKGNLFYYPENEKTSLF